MINYEQLKINRLYKLLNNLEKVGDLEDAAAVRWAIFQLEQIYTRSKENDKNN